MEATLIPDLVYLDAPAAPVPHLPPTVLGPPWVRRLALARLQVAEAQHVLRLLRTPGRLRRGLAGLVALRQAYYGPLAMRKVAHVAGRYYREYQIPGWPSAAYDAWAATTVNRIVPCRPGHDTLNQVFLAITKKCPLACAHCFEWDALNQPEALSRADLHQLVAAFQDRHATQIFFSGGEPMLRVNDLVAVVQAARPGTDFWVITSGFNFTRENAQRLRRAGFTGVTVSLDHHAPAQHNAFRGSPQAYQNAVQAVEYAHAAGLVVNLSLCATRQFTTAANLWAYASLARQLGVTFIQILEPRAVGHYVGKDVDLRPEQLQLLEDFYQQMVNNPAYRDWPIVHYYGYHQRRMGCAGAADRFLYVDTDGDLHACPFCQQKRVSALGDALETSLAAVQCAGCHAFKEAEL